MSKTRLVAVLVLTIGMLAPPATTALLPADGYPSVEPASGDPRVAVLSGPEDRPRSVLERLRGVSRSADVALDARVAGSGEDLLESIRSSEARLLIVAVHGDDAAIEVGDDRIRRSRVVDAVRASDAERILLATCDLDLPTRLGGTHVRDYEGGKVDAAVAAVDAVAAWMDVHRDRPGVVRALRDGLTDLLDDIGGRVGYLIRTVRPKAPLTMTSEGAYWIDRCSDRWYMDSLYCTSVYACNDSDGDGWVEDRWHEVEVRPVEDACRKVDANDERDLRYDSWRAARGSGELVGPLARHTWEALKEGGLVAYKTDTTVDGTDYRVYLTFGKTAGQQACIPIFAFDSGTVKGVARGALKEGLEDAAEDQVDRLLSWTKENDAWVGLRACGKMEIGIPATDEAGSAAGRISAQLGAGGQSEFRIPYTKADVDYGLNVYLDAGLTVRIETSDEIDNHAECSSGDCFKLELSLSVDGHLLPWGGRAFMPFSKTFWGPWSGGWIVDYGEDGASSSTSSRSWQSPDGALLYSLLGLSDAHLSSIGDDPDQRRRLTSELGMSIAEAKRRDVVVDLTDPTYCDLFTRGDGCEAAAVELSDGHVEDGIAGDVAGIDLATPATCRPGLDVDVGATCGSTTQSSPAPAKSSESIWSVCTSSEEVWSGTYWPDEALGNRSDWTGNASACAGIGTASTSSAGSVNRPDPPVEEVCEEHTDRPCPWVSAAVLCAVAVESTAEGDTTWDVCDVYGNATTSRSMAEGEGDRFQMRMEMTNASEMSWTTAVDLCPSGGIAGVCQPGHVTGTALSSGEVWLVDDYYDRKLQRHLGGSLGLPCLRDALAPLLDRPVDAAISIVGNEAGPVSEAWDCVNGPVLDGYETVDDNADRKRNRVASFACTIARAVFEDNAGNYLSYCREGAT